MLFLVTFGAGLVLAWIFQKRQSLLAPVITHAVFNGLSLLAVLAGQAA
ncbi:MAG: type II CAAX prenyl endopeptidase Rce1 family protein [Myxococcales bacterium]